MCVHNVVFSWEKEYGFWLECVHCHATSSVRPNARDAERAWESVYGPRRIDERIAKNVTEARR